MQAMFSCDTLRKQKLNYKEAGWEEYLFLLTSVLEKTPKNTLDS